MMSEPQLQSLVAAIVRAQYAVIGPIAIEQANSVPGISVDNEFTVRVPTTVSGTVVLEKLTERYKSIFGLTSVEVCREAVIESDTQVSATDLPTILQ